MVEWRVALRATINIYAIRTAVIDLNDSVERVGVQLATKPTVMVDVTTTVPVDSIGVPHVLPPCALFQLVTVAVSDPAVPLRTENVEAGLILAPEPLI